VPTAVTPSNCDGEGLKTSEVFANGCGGQRPSSSSRRYSIDGEVNCDGETAAGVDRQLRTTDVAGIDDRLATSSSERCQLLTSRTTTAVDDDDNESENVVRISDDAAASAAAAMATLLSSSASSSLLPPPSYDDVMLGRI
jgi:hypothetical protein